MCALAAPRTSFARLFTWGGAFLFFVSIAYFLFAYLTRFGVPASSGDAAAAITWNVALFTLFALHHSVFAREPVRARVSQAFPGRLERSFYVWVASLLFLAVCASWRPVPGVIWDVDGVLRGALWVLQVGGAVLTLRSATVIDIRALAGLPSGRAAVTAEFKTDGPYAWVRHPIYAGWFLLVWPTSPMTGTRLVFAVVSCVYLVVAIPLEERTLRAGSAAYERYARQVRWKLVPGVY